MTVTSVSKRATVPSSSKPWWSAVAKVVATGIGSDMPVLSMSTWSKRRSNAIARTLSMRSSRRVQQMQPLWSSTTLSLLSSSCTPSCSSFASTLMDAMSLTSTATRLPSRLFRTCVISVVFPAPRNPLSTVTGSFSASFKPTNLSRCSAGMRSTVMTSCSRRCCAEFGDLYTHGFEAPLMPPLRRTMSPVPADCSAEATDRFHL
mmetsp:Transcript_119335/g.363058  ORF Transcript_119335/g.363058 Transcript_119335/m.363058 type:complete len:204 (+) Transcript_119335:854-1465(+)